MAQKKFHSLVQKQGLPSRNMTLPATLPELSKEEKRVYSDFIQTSYWFSSTKRHKASWRGWTLVKGKGSAVPGVAEARFFQYSSPYFGWESSNKVWASSRCYSNRSRTSACSGESVRLVVSQRSSAILNSWR